MQCNEIDFPMLYTMMMCEFICNAQCTSAIQIWYVDIYRIILLRKTKNGQRKENKNDLNMYVHVNKHITVLLYRLFIQYTVESIVSLLLRC
jgi:hypothetical protein